MLTVYIQKREQKNVIEVHGVLPDTDTLEDDDFPLIYDGIVLYGDLAPKYEVATKLVKSLEYNNSYFVVVGTSFYTGTSEQLMKLAKQRKSHIVVVNDNATQRVLIICNSMKHILENK